MGRKPDMGNSDLLSIYLRDHHAGAVAGHELVKRSAKANQGTPFGDLLESLEEEIAEDRTALEEFMALLGIDPAKGKDAAAWTAEKLGRLKLNGSLTKYSPLSRVVELEGLSIVIEGKKSLWDTLQRLDDQRLDTERLEELKQRADDQKSRLAEAKEEAVRIAFSTEPLVI
jgi:hypothetical protein